MKVMQGSICRLLVLGTMILGLLPTVQAQSVAPHTVSYSDNQVQAKFMLGQSFDLALSLEFDQVVGLHPANLDISAEIVMPTDPRVVDRLPSSLVDGVAGFPVLVSVQPKSDKGFAFEGLANIEFYTKAIHFDPTVPWRLFTSHDEGTFEDITTLTSTGSYRARGSTGRFSDFIILLDSRDTNTIIEHKFALLSDTLRDNRAMLPAAVTTLLDPLMLTLESAILTFDTDSALTASDALIAALEDTTGNTVPDVWRSSGDIVNVKGDLLSRLYTLRYTLRTQ
ncbi:hypothetical protein IT774_02015 [Salinimonas marina]|uniref:Uncharacterized protein n=1 Tax=Salinimonas marina TaxID=2785918 RepID=A0A7S9DY23_9ALTE|nr:DUF6689 family protein [Salinimonas marina]QPG06044.1 hypothetical protein IT774_02015 [Salinimonas marina]